MREVNPGVIYCSVSGFGQTGPLRDRAAIDQIVQSLSGLMYLTGQEGDPATRIGFPIVDTFTGLLAAFAIQTAVVQRERGMARGQHIDVAMLDATLVMLLSVVNPLLATGEASVRSGNRGFSGAPTADTFACATGEITIGAVEDRQVDRLLGVLGAEALLEDARFADRLSRIANADAMRAELAEAFAREDATVWEERLQAAGVPAARVLSVAEAAALPHLAERDLFIETGEGRILNAGYRFAEGGPGTDRPAPRLGEKTTSQINRGPER